MGFSNTKDAMGGLEAVGQDADRVNASRAAAMQGAQQLQQGEGGPRSESLGDKITSYLKSRYPVAHGVGSAMFNPDNGNAGAVIPQQAPLPQAELDQNIIAQNARPKEGGLATLLKLLIA